MSLKFKSGKKIEKSGKIIGYLIAYFIFTTILYFILKFSKRVPSDWGYPHIMILTLFIVLLGTLIKLLLK